jgi:hypothetical protein
MSSVFHPLFTAVLAHDYYGGPFTDLEFVTPPATAQALASLRLLARVRDNVQYVLYEADPAGGGAPRIDPSGAVLSFGLRLANPGFVNITDPVTTDPAQRPLYANLADPRKLDAPRGVVLVAGLYRYAPKNAARPLTVAVRPAGGGTAVASQALATGDTAALFDLRALADGWYTVDEDPGGGPVASTDLYVSGDLVELGVWGVLRVAVGAGFAAAPPAFTLSFQARSQPLKYYVIAENLSQAEFDQLGVSDAGFTDDGRAQLVFTKVLPAAFGAGDLPPATLAAAPARLALFRSQDPVPRRARGYHKLQLSRNGDVVVENLPLPRPDRPDADLVVHVSKLI